MSNLPLSSDERAQRWATFAKWAGFAVCGFLVSPFILATIQGMAGLIVVGAICGFVHYMSPVAQQMAFNLRLKMIKAEASRNPIETLETEKLRRQTMLNDRIEAVQRFDAKTHTFGDKLMGFKRDYPAEAPKYQEIYDQMVLLLKRQQQQIREAKGGLIAFDKEIDKAKAIYSMACAANEARAGSGFDEDSFYAKLKTDTALDSIQDSLNTAFAQLDSLVLEGDNEGEMKNVTPAQQALPSPSSSVIEINPSKVKTAS